MSLDVYLEYEPREVSCVCSTCDQRHTRMDTPVEYWRNITHNLIPMARAAGLYEALWCPDEYGVERAEQLVVTLDAGLNRLLAEPAHYRKYNPANGWGTYEGLCDFVCEYLNACRRYPDARVRVSR